MNLNPGKPQVASYYFRDLYGVLVVRRVWQGIEYLGLPAAEIGPVEPFAEHARKIIAPGRKGESDMAMILKLDSHYSWIGGSENYEWGGRAVALNIFSFPGSEIVAPMNSRATRIMLDELMGEWNPAFDVTIMLLRERLRNHSENAAA